MQKLFLFSLLPIFRTITGTNVCEILKECSGNKTNCCALRDSYAVKADYEQFVFHASDKTYLISSDGSGSLAKDSLESCDSSSLKFVLRTLIYTMKLDQQNVIFQDEAFSEKFYFQLNGDEVSIVSYKSSVDSPLLTELPFSVISYTHEDGLAILNNLPSGDIYIEFPRKSNIFRDKAQARGGKFGCGDSTKFSSASSFSVWFLILLLLCMSGGAGFYYLKILFLFKYILQCFIF